MTVLIIFAIILLLVLLIAWGKINAFLAFLIVSIIGGLWLGIPLTKVMGAVQKGIGDTLGSLAIIIILGAMLGKLVADSGAAQKICSVLMKAFGFRYIQLALVLTGFTIGIPLFYNVGFVLVVPLIFTVVYQYKLPAIYIGLPMLAALSVTFGFLPPHPAPTALAVQFKANIGLTLLYGILIAIPAIVVAGPLFSQFLKNIPADPLKTFQPKELAPDKLPSTTSSFLAALLPVILLMLTAVLPFVVVTTSNSAAILSFLGEPAIVMLLSLAVATWVLGINRGIPMKDIMNSYADSVKEVSLILLIIGSAGALKQVLIESGVSQQIAQQLNKVNLHPLVLAWLIAAAIRICVGSATVAGLTTGGIFAPMVLQSQIHPSLMVLSIGAGSLAFSHVNDSGFWMFKEYFNLSIKDTLRTWTVMETLVAIVGLVGVLVIHLFV
ncbi:gluconate:H+ symporter [Flavisolibacter tropicus]|uniref:Gluconate transporter n=1 Tax=Flavisolibacter tropicus TaxID=1492898 RepID=A0A172TRN0_9BACT|nr:gluconate:H+ symporter [Flavisolibacter tropicus]ANE49642.1 gluconate transporter [Flavisolibacter tropicus]